MSRATRSPGAVLVGASAAQTSVSLVNFGLPSIGPQLSDALDMSLFWLGAVLASGLLGAGLALIAAGSAVDRMGARRAMLIGTAIGTTGLVAAAFMPSAPTLFAALLVFGLGSAVVPVAGTGALFTVYPPARRGWALGIRQTAVPLGGTIAAVTYPGLFALGGVEVTMLGSAVVLAATGIAFAVVTGDDRTPAASRIERPFRTILAAPGLRRLLAVAACYIIVLQALLAYIVPAVRDAGHSQLTAAVAYFGINVAAIVARIVWGTIADRNAGSRRVRTLVEVGVLAAGGALAFAVALHGSGAVIVVAAVLFGLGALGWNALVYVSAGERVDASLAGRSVAVAATVVFVLSGIATPVLGAVADEAGWDALWLTTALIALLGAVLATRLGEVATLARVRPDP